jgi:hypothetical protein
VRDAVWVKCSGQAHTPEVGGMQDDCRVCVPHWGEYPTCPDCGRKLRSEKIADCRNRDCVSFRKRFNVKSKT